MPSNDEVIIIVDKHNNVIGDIPRHLMDFDNNYHRVTYILVFNLDGQLIIQKRADNKAFCPGYYGITTGGVVDKDESYIDSAHRELQEELGFDAPLTSHGVFLTEGKGFKVWGKIFTCVYDPSIQGKLTLQPKEVSAVSVMSVEEILKNPNDLRFTPDSFDALKHYTHKLTQAKHDDPI